MGVGVFSHGTERTVLTLLFSKLLTLIKSKDKNRIHIIPVLFDALNQVLTLLVDMDLMFCHFFLQSAGVL